MYEINIQNGVFTNDYEFAQYPFNLSDFQKNAIYALDNGHNVLVSAPTSCGKTLVAEHIIQKACKLSDKIIKRKVIYTTPIKALSNCLFNELSRKFPDISFGILTGDIKYNPNADCVVMTTEILRNLLYNKKLKTSMELSIEIDVYSEVYSVVFDEVHYIANPERGSVWEECLVLLPSDIKLVLLSATIDKPEKFGKWIQDIKGVPLTLASTYKRIVPLKHYVYLSFIPKFDKVKKTIEEDDIVEIFNNNLVEIMNADNKFDAKQYDKAVMIKNKYNKFVSRNAIFTDLGNYLKAQNLVPAIIFTLSRKKCEEYSRQLKINFNTQEESIEALHIFDKELRQSDNYQYIIKMPEYFIIKDLIEKGIAFHHSGIYHTFKEVIERMLAYKDTKGTSKSLIKLLFATETFAVGVNIPVKASCYSGLTKYSDGEFRYLKSYEYRQMSGRAGRRGMDSKGVTILIPNLYDLPTSNDMNMIMNGPNQTIVSRFTPNFQFILKLILTGNNQIMDFIKRSLLNTDIINEALSIEKDIESISIPDIDFSECIEYDNLTQQNHSIVKISQKTLKNNRKLANLISKKPDFDEKYKKYTFHRDHLDKIYHLKEDLKCNHSYIHTTITKLLGILVTNNYLDKLADIVNYENINPEQVSLKGVIASQINECNEILFTETLANGYLDGLSPEELVAVVAVFINTKVESDSEYTISTLNITDKTRNAIEYIYKISEGFNTELNRERLYINSNWDLSLNMIEPIYEWVKGETEFNQIVSQYGLYSGNFVKDIVKVNNIVQDIVQMATVIDKIELAASASTIEQKIIRDNVNMESLYVKM